MVWDQGQGQRGQCWASVPELQDPPVTGGMWDPAEKEKSPFECTFAGIVRSLWALMHKDLSWGYR